MEGDNNTEKVSWRHTANGFGDVQKAGLWNFSLWNVDLYNHIMWQVLFFPWYIYIYEYIETQEGKIAFKRSHMWGTYDLNLGMSEPSNYAYALSHLVLFPPYIHADLASLSFHIFLVNKDSLSAMTCRDLDLTFGNPFLGGMRPARGVYVPDWWFRDPKVSPISMLQTFVHQ